MTTMWLVLLTIAVVALSLVTRFNPEVRPWLRSKTPWLVQSWTASAYFVYWQAHIWFAVSVMLFCHCLGFNPWIVAVIGLNCAAIKEFIYDYVWEEPEQTDEDDWKDFAGYTIGVVPIGLPICLALRFFERV